MLRKLPILLCILALTISFSIDYTQKRDINFTLSPIQSDKNTAIFAAYSEDGSISDYVVTYLKKLKEIAPNIIYVTDNQMSKNELRKLKPYVNHVIAHRHGEYDWGSFKRGYKWLIAQNTTPHTNALAHPHPLPLLILANDSTITLAESFKPIIADMQQKQADVYGITANTDGTYHIQSYFMVLNNKAYNNTNFANYLNNVKKEADGLTVAYRYEVPFTQYMQNLGYKTATYIPYESLQHLPLNDKNCYPLTLISQYNMPLLKMRTFTNRLTVQEPRRLVFSWLKKHKQQTYEELIKHLKKINSPYLSENK